MSDDTPKFHPDVFILENQIRLHEWIVFFYKHINTLAKPLAKGAVTKLVAEKPMGSDQARRMIRPEDFEKATASGPGGKWAVVRLLDRDPVIAALVSKAVATKEAVVHLGKAGFGADAYALTRTLLENTIVISWLLPDDASLRESRIDTFILHMEAFLVRFETVRLAQHEKHGTTPDPDYGTTPRTREISAEVFDDKWMYWAWMEDRPGKSKSLVRLRQMAEEVGSGEFYDRDYFAMSAFVHSAPASVFEHSGGPAETIHAGKVFSIRPELFANPESFVRTAIGLSNAYMHRLLDVINRRFELGLSEELRFLELLYLIDPKGWPAVPTEAAGK